MASARASSCWLAGALPAAASAVAAAWSAMRRRVAVSVIPGRAAAACSRSNSATGRVRAVNTAALAGPGVHAHGHEQTQRLPPARPRLDLDRAGSDGGQHGQGEHPSQVRWRLGRGSDPSHVLAQPARQDLDRERGHLSPTPERDGRLPAVPTVRGGGAVGQLAHQVGQHGRVGVGVGQSDAQVDHPAAPGRVGDQAGVVARVGHRGDGLDQGVQERAAAHVGQFAAVVQLPQQGDGVGGLAPVGQAQHGPPDGPVGGPVEVGLLEEGGDLAQQPPRSQDRPEHGLLSLQVVRWLAVRLGHRTQAAPGRPRARTSLRHGRLPRAGRRGLRAPLPRRCGGVVCWSMTCLT